MRRSKLSERLKELRTAMGLSQIKLAEAIGVNSVTIAKIETGERSTSIETLIIFAGFFNVTTDYLLGLSNKKNY